ncbi:TetR/AcrR family transcriptional regulator [Zavarzinia sp. CC-PAN008]|uniref:TetR/AcrR family transcriptional regulator n=1 Tax=Zavarzinia sp. CC-PAN008 TaxID=3243332 RepID=UPI003F7429CB
MRQRFLDAGEALFAEKGFWGPSAREIARAANANVNLLSYHFGSMEGLFRAVMERLVEPINRLRGEMIDALDLKYAPDPAPVAEVVRTIIHPLMRLAREDPQTFGRFFKLQTKMWGSPLGSAVLSEELSDVVRRQTAVLHRALPRASRADVISLVLMAYVMTITGSELMSPEAVGLDMGMPGSVAEIEDRLVRAMTAAAEAYR